MVDPLPHFFQPGADLCAFLVERSPLLTTESVDLQSFFLAIGGFGKVSLSSGF